MRKLYKLIITLIFLLPITVYADGSMSITCSPSTVKPGGTSTCTIKATSSEIIDSLQAKVTLDNGLTVQSFSHGNNLQGDSDVDNGYIQLYGGDASGTIDVGVLVVKVASGASDGDLNVTLDDYVLYNDKGKKSATGKASAKITVSSSSNPDPEPSGSGLSALSIDKKYGIMSPTFNPSNNVTNYIIVLDINVTTFSIQATPKNSSDTLTFKKGEKSLSSLNNIPFEATNANGQMIIKIIVGSGSNAITYTLAVTKTSAPTFEHELSSLTVGGKSITLVKGQYDYTIVLDDVSKYQVNASLTNPTNYSIANLSFPVYYSGEKQFLIDIVQKSNPSVVTRSYAITVKKSNKQSEDPEPSKPTPKPNPNQDVDTNPETGNNVAIIMALVLVLSFSLTIYLYKKNIEKTEN